MKKPISFDLQSFLKNSAALGVRTLQPIHVSSEKDLNQQVSEAWDTSLNYPTISQSIIAGDHVAIVVQNSLPAINQVAEMLALRVQTELNAEVTLVVTPSAWVHYWRDQKGSVKIVQHNAEDQNELAMLAIGSDHQPLYVNRVLFDADVVLPVCCVNPRDDIRQSDCVVPKYLGSENQQRFATLTPGEKLEMIRQVNENLGTFLDFQVVLAPGRVIDAVLSGQRDDVTAEAVRRLANCWRFPIGRLYQTVIGTIETPGFSQSWEDFGLAVVAADECASAGAAIVILSELSGKPPRDLRMAFAGQFSSLSSQMTDLARQVAEIMASHPVYLVSLIGRNEVESLGIGYLQTAEELERLIARNGDALLIRDAHQIIVEYTEPLKTK